MITPFRFYSFVLLVVVLLSAGCITSGGGLEASIPKGAKQINGTIVQKSLEGGFFAIDGDDDQKYLPINLPEDFKQEGLKVSVIILPRPDIMSMYMYGENVEILDIRKIE